MGQHPQSCFSSFRRRELCGRNRRPSRVLLLVAEWGGDSVIRLPRASTQSGSRFPRSESPSQAWPNLRAAANYSQAGRAPNARVRSASSSLLIRLYRAASRERIVSAGGAVPPSRQGVEFATLPCLANDCTSARCRSSGTAGLDLDDDEVSRRNPMRVAESPPPSSVSVDQPPGASVVASNLALVIILPVGERVCRLRERVASRRLSPPDTRLRPIRVPFAARLGSIPEPLSTVHPRLFLRRERSGFLGTAIRCRPRHVAARRWPAQPGRYRDVRVPPTRSSGAPSRRRTR